LQSQIAMTGAGEKLASEGSSTSAEGALAGLRVLDFSTLLPGPLATLMLAECGAEVIKVERPGTGDEMRERMPKFGESSASFALLNRGKRSVALDLKLDADRLRLRPLLESADVLVEQFRPGVMDRLGLGYSHVRAANPRIVYCSMTGYGQSGPRAQKAGHDLNYLAEAGLLSLTASADGTPSIPAAPIADLAGGSYAAVINILLALQQRARTGEGCHLDIAMADNLFPFVGGTLARGFAAGDWPAPGAGEWTGASPRYRLYRTLDQRFLAVAAVESRFWKNFCAAIGLDPAAATSAQIEPLIAARTAEEWERLFGGQDVCVSLVATLEEATRDAESRDPESFSRSVTTSERSMPALPLPLAVALRRTAQTDGYPSLGGDNALLDRPQ
jgi:alpha-methylacyl-CoA racemase